MTEWIIVSRHAAQRWHERVESPGVGPIIAWNEAERRDIADLDGDEVRLHRATGTLLIRHGNVLATVIDAETAKQPIHDAVYAAEVPGV